MADICRACRRPKPIATLHKHGKKNCPSCHADFRDSEPERFFGRWKQKVARLRSKRFWRNRERRAGYGSIRMR